METCFNYTYDPYHNDHQAYFSSDEKRWINKVHKWAQEQPDQVVIIREPEENDGCIYAKVPQSFLKVSPPRHMSDEQKEKLSEILRNARESQ